MKVLLLGIGMQGKAALHDLVKSKAVTQILAADIDDEMLKKHVAEAKYVDKVICRALDAADPNALRSLIAEGPDVVIDLLPVEHIDTVTSIAVDYGCHLVNTMPVTPKMQAMSAAAKSKNIAILPEFGLDPGIDLVLLGQAIRSFDEITVIKSYGAGLPEPAAIDNPLKYKATWTFVGALRAYCRKGILINDGKLQEVKGKDIFNPKNVHEVEIDSLGKFEAYPNGGVADYLALLGMEQEQLKLVGRYTLRWPGHCAFWKTLVDLSFLDDEPVVIDGLTVDRKKYLAAVIEPHIQLKDGERDIALVRLDVEGRINGQHHRRIYQLLDYRDLNTGFTAMSRTVGFTASIGAQVLFDGRIKKRGLLSPVTDIPYELLVDELAKRNIQLTEIIM